MANEMCGCDIAYGPEHDYYGDFDNEECAFPEAVKIIFELRIGSCWCPVAIGNPMYKDHTLVCKSASKFLNEHR